METYTETVLRYVVEYLEKLPPEHQAAMRINGIDPDNNWCLKWSFNTEEDANNQLRIEEEWYQKFCEEHGFTPSKKFRVRDLGETQYIERTVMI